MKHSHCLLYGVVNPEGLLCMTEFFLLDDWGSVEGVEAYCGARFERDVELVMPYRIRGSACRRCLVAFATVMLPAA